MTRFGAVTSPGPSYALDDFINKSRQGPDDLFPGVIPSSALTIFGGARRSFKSFALAELLFACASGEKWLGMSSNRIGSVLYVAEEGGMRHVGHRFAMLRSEYQPRNDVRVLFREGITFQNAETWHIIEETLSAMSGPILVGLDTYSQMNDGDENASSAAATRAISAIIKRFGVSVVLVHHTGHDGKHLRGHSSLPAAADATVMFKRGAKSDTVTLDIETKDSEERELKLEWSSSTYLLTPVGTAKEVRAAEGVDRVVRAVTEHLRIHPGVPVRTSDIQKACDLSDTTVAKYAAMACQSGALVRATSSRNSPMGGYLLPTTSDAALAVARPDHERMSGKPN